MIDQDREFVNTFRSVLVRDFEDVEKRYARYVKYVNDDRVNPEQEDEWI